MGLSAIKELIAEQAALIDALDARSMAALLPVLQSAREELRRDLHTWLARAPGDEERFTAQRMREALVSIEAALEQYGHAGVVLEQTLRGNAAAAAALSTANLQQQLALFAGRFAEPLRGVDLVTAARIARGDELRYRHYASSARRYAGQLGDDIRQQLAVGVARRETFFEMKQRLMRIGGVRTGESATDIAYGFAARDRYRAERLVRTELMSAYNQQHRESIEHLDAQREPGEPRIAQQWDASLDKRVCRVCRDLDGKTAYPGKTFSGGYLAPPAHPCCRCVLVAWSPEWGARGGPPS